MRDGKPIHRMERTHDSDYSIVCQYQAEYRGFVQYYQRAQLVARYTAIGHETASKV